MGRLPLVLSLLLVMSINARPEDFSKLAGPYLGQKPPGSEPELFAPGIVSREGYFEHSAAIFTPDGTEVFWTAKADSQREYKIHSMKLIDGCWTRPSVPDFCRENKYYQTCVLSSDGKKLYFTDGSSWQYVEKRNGIWSSPIRVSTDITSGADVNICAVTGSGSVYFIKRPEHDVYVARAVKGGYDAPEKLGESINSGDTRENSVFVSPDERTMIIEATRDASTCELFVSFKNDHDEWSERMKLPIKWGRHPFVSPDGKYLFFMTRDGVYWVSTEIIAELRPKE